MPKFLFPLEVVLHQRKNAEDQAQRELAKVLRQRMILMDQLRMMQTNIRQSKADLRGGLTGQVDMTAVSQFARYSLQTTARAQSMVAKLAGTERLVDAARARLIAATKARKALDRLRERQFRRWKTEQDRREAAMLDEIGASRYAYQMAAGPTA